MSKGASTDDGNSCCLRLLIFFGILVFLLGELARLLWLLVTRAWDNLPGGLNEKLTLISIVVVIITATLTGWPSFKLWLIKRFIERYRGPEIYDKRIVRENARYYIRPRATSNDPTSSDPNKGDFNTPNPDEVDLFKFIDTSIGEGRFKFLWILADAGMGKTSFAVNYFIYNARRFLPWHRRQLIVRYLGFSNDIVTELDNIPVDEKSVTTLILDGFDEDPKAAINYKERWEEIVKASAYFKHIIITCRTQFFPSDSEIPTLIQSFTSPYPRGLGETAQIKFLVTYLAPFRDKQVKKYIRKRYPRWKRAKRAKLYSLVNQIPELAMRPMVLAYGDVLGCVDITT
jgi:hypothetical protein